MEKVIKIALTYIKEKEQISTREFILKCYNLLLLHKINQSVMKFISLLTTEGYIKISDTSVLLSSLGVETVEDTNRS